MKKQSKLLKVLSIFLIIFGVLGLLGSIVSIAMMDSMKATFEALGTAAPTMLSYVISIIGTLITLAAGIIGVSYKSRQLVLIMGIILLVFEVISIIFTAVTISFSAFGLVSLIWPLLYLWGWYQSN